MDYEDEIDRQFNNSQLLIRKNLVILVLFLISILFFLMAYTQKQSDDIDCTNRIIYNNSGCFGSIYDVNLGAIVHKNSSITMINLTKK
jgi:hypothetical protein